MFAATPTAPVAVNVAGVPTPVAVADSVLLPAAGPSVQLPTVAIPDAFVVFEVPVAEPPPLSTANATPTPETTLLHWAVTTTLGSTATACPAVALRQSPAFTVTC